MNIKNIIAAAAIFAATGSAFAQGTGEFVEFTDFVSTKSRAEVTAEIAQAAPAQEFVEHVNVASTRSRAEVREEVLQAARQARTNVDG